MEQSRIARYEKIEVGAEETLGLCMEYDERQLLYRREMKLKERFSALDTGMYINGKIERFSEAIFFEEKMQVMLPQSFGIMPEGYARVKYPSSFRSQILLTKADISVNIGFSLLAHKASEADLQGMSAYIKNILKRADPRIQFYGEERAETTNCIKTWYDFRTQALDEAMYNIHFLAIVDKCVMQGMFNCMYRDVDEWYDMAIQVIESITDLTREQRG